MKQEDDDRKQQDTLIDVKIEVPENADDAADIFHTMQNDTADDTEKGPTVSPAADSGGEENVEHAASETTDATVNDKNGDSLTDETADTILPGTDGAKRLPLMERLMATKTCRWAC